MRRKGRENSCNGRYLVSGAPFRLDFSRQSFALQRQAARTAAAKAEPLTGALLTGRLQRSPRVTNRSAVPTQDPQKLC